MNQYAIHLLFQANSIKRLNVRGHLHGVSTTKTEVFFKSTENYPIL